MKPTRVTVLGATGSIGRSALDVIRQHPERFEVAGLAARANIDLLAAQTAEFRPETVAVADPEAARALQARGLGAHITAGPEALAELATRPVDVVLCAIVGAVGLTPALKAIEAGNRIAMANKEPLVMAGQIIMPLARERGVTILPVDSEHNAIFQCLQGHRKEDVRCIHLTASGGPFYREPAEALEHVTPRQAVNHPTWDMGAKISVDSATLMNKGLEVIEAMWLFDLPLDKIEVIIHPQSTVHGLVEFNDGSLLGHLGVTDMRFPIQFALTWPERVQCPLDRLDLAALGELTFAAPDFSRFPCLRLALEAAQCGGAAPTVLNAANEAAVEAFRKGRIPFTGIARIVETVLTKHGGGPADALEDVWAADAWARAEAENAVARA